MASALTTALLLFAFRLPPGVPVAAVMKSHSHSNTYKPLIQTLIWHEKSLQMSIRAETENSTKIWVIIR